MLYSSRKRHVKIYLKRTLTSVSWYMASMVAWMALPKPDCVLVTFSIQSSTAERRRAQGSRYCSDILPGLILCVGRHFDRHQWISHRYSSFFIVLLLPHFFHQRLRSKLNTGRAEVWSSLNTFIFFDLNLSLYWLSRLVVFMILLFILCWKISVFQPLSSIQWSIRNF